MTERAKNNAYKWAIGVLLVIVGILVGPWIKGGRDTSAHEARIVALEAGVTGAADSVESYQKEHASEHSNLDDTLTELVTVVRFLCVEEYGADKCPSGDR